MVNYGSSCGDMGGVQVLGVLVVCGLVTYLRSLTPFIHAPTVTMINEASFSDDIQDHLPDVISPPRVRHLPVCECRVQVCRSVKPAPSLVCRISRW